MPIVDVELVGDQPGVAQGLADALGRVFGSPPGRTWVRVRALPASDYAENDAVVPADALPCFVTVLHARLPGPEALADQVAAVTAAVAAALARDPDLVHVQYAPAGAGRQAFGGRLVP